MRRPRNPAPPLSEGVGGTRASDGEWQAFYAAFGPPVPL